jgi:pimeloyl-ACP methyl ester carboxylesterase
MVPLSVHRFESFDGTEIAYYQAGRIDGPAMVMCNGLGGNIVVWRKLIERFAKRFRILCWDYRGLYGSSPARQPEAYAIPNHARDLVALIEHERVRDPVLVGWSMGVQVSLELHRTHPELPSALVAIHGTQGNALRTAFDSAVTERVAPAVFAAMRRIGRGLEEIGPPFARSPLVIGSLVWACQRTGVMSRDICIDSFSELAEEWLQMDMAAYAAIFEQLGEHAAWDLLPAIDTPTLVIAGGADRFTPAHLSTRMAEEMPDAILRTVDEATHFGLLEYPEEIVEHIDEYLVERHDLGRRGRT